jgi:hypothetical protein
MDEEHFLTMKLASIGVKSREGLQEGIGELIQRYARYHVDYPEDATHPCAEQWREAAFVELDTMLFDAGAVLIEKDAEIFDLQETVKELEAKIELLNKELEETENG